MTLFRPYNQLVAGVTFYVDSSSSAYIKVSDDNERYDFLIQIQILEFF